MVPEENLVFDPETTLREVVWWTHYLPNGWKGRLHSKMVRLIVFAFFLASLFTFPYILSLPETIGKPLLPSSAHDVLSVLVSCHSMYLLFCRFASLLSTFLTCPSLPRTTCLRDDPTLTPRSIRNSVQCSN
jgi:hypothetical protein